MPSWFQNRVEVRSLSLWNSGYLQLSLLICHQHRMVGKLTEMEIARYR